MTREKVKEILGEGATDEQVSSILNAFHSDLNAKDEEISSKEKEINSLNSKLDSQSDYDAIKKELDKIHKENMSEQEKLEEQKKEIEKNLRESKIIVNTAKAKEILSGLNISDDIINSLVRDDEQATISNASNLKAQIESLKDAENKKVREELANADVKPNVTNVPQGSDTMTWEKFTSLSQEEQNAFAEEHPEEFKNL